MCFADTLPATRLCQRNRMWALCISRSLNSVLPGLSSPAKQVCESDWWGVWDHREEHQPGCPEDPGPAREGLWPNMHYSHQQTGTRRVGAHSQTLELSTSHLTWAFVAIFLPSTSAVQFAGLAACFQGSGLQYANACVPVDQNVAKFIPIQLFYPFQPSNYLPWLSSNIDS